MIDTDRLATWMDGVGLVKGEPIEHRFISGGTQNEIYEVRRGDVHAALRIPPPGAPGPRDEGIVREYRLIKALDVAAAWLRAHRPLDFVPGIMHGDYQFANVMYRHGAPARLAAIVDWEMGTVGDPKLDLAWVVHGWPDDTDGPGDAFAGYVDMTAMPARHEILARDAEVSGRQVDDIDYYVVLAKWKLAVADDRRRILAFRRVMCCAYRTRDTPERDRTGHRRGVLRVRAAVCRSYGPPETVEVDELPAPAVGPGQVRVRIAAAAVNFPDVLLVADRYQMTVPTPFVPGSEFAGLVTEVGPDLPEGAEVAVGDRVAGTTLVGAFAEEVVVGADAVRRIPDGVDLRHAAAFGVAPPHRLPRAALGRRPAGR